MPKQCEVQCELCDLYGPDVIYDSEADAWHCQDEEGCLLRHLAQQAIYEEVIVLCDEFA